MSAPNGAKTVIKSPEQYEFPATPVLKDGSKFALALTVIIFESVLLHEIGSSKIPFPFAS